MRLLSSLLLVLLLLVNLQTIFASNSVVEHNDYTPPESPNCKYCRSYDKKEHIYNNELVFKAHVISYSPKAEDGFYKLNIKVLDVCDKTTAGNKDWVVGYETKIWLPVTACKIHDLKRDVAYSFLATWKKYGDVTVPSVSSCGFDHEDEWDKIKQWCTYDKDMCHDCPKDIIWLLKENPLAFSATVISVTDEYVKNVPFIRAVVKVLDSCNYNPPVGTTTLYIPKDACNVEWVRKGNTLTFFGSYEYDHILIDDCGVTKIDFTQVLKFCEPCADCDKKDFLWYIKNEYLTFKAKVVDVEYVSKDYVYAHVYVIYYCYEHEEIKMDKLVKLWIPTHACNLELLKEGAILTFAAHYTDYELRVDKCGILEVTDAQWNDHNVLQYCKKKDTCKQCKNDIIWLLKANELAFSALVKETQITQIDDKKFVKATVDVLQSCGGNPDPYGTETIQIFIPIFACNVEWVKEGAVLTFFGSESYGRILIDDCGVTKIDFAQVLKFCEPCKECEKKDLLWYVQQKYLTFKAKVVDVEYVSKDYVYAHVYILHYCYEHESLQTYKVVKLWIPTHACNLELLTKGAILTFAAHYTDYELRVDKCGILKVTDDDWKKDTVKQYCLPPKDKCDKCPDDLLWLVKGNQLAFSATVKASTVGDALVRIGDKYFVHAYVVDFCPDKDHHFDQTHQEIYIPHDACHLEWIHETRYPTITFFGAYVDGHIVIDRCGITLVDFKQVKEICEPCAKCQKQDLLWYLKSEHVAFKGEVLQVKEKNKEHLYAEIKVLKYCHKKHDPYFKQKYMVHVWVPKTACDVDLLAEGAILTFVAEKSDSELRILQCGIIHDDWDKDDVKKMCTDGPYYPPNKPPYPPLHPSCPLVIVRKDHAKCLCKNTRRKVCAVDGYGEKKTMPNACVAKCFDMTVVCDVRCEVCTGEPCDEWEQPWKPQLEYW